MIGIDPDHRPRPKARFLTPLGYVTAICFIIALVIAWVLVSAALRR